MGAESVADLTLNLEKIVSAPFAENTFICWLEGRRDCLVIDPGLEPQRILDFLDRNQLSPAAILNTHGHSDHIAGNGTLKERWPDCPLVIGTLDAPKLTDSRLNLSAIFGFNLVSPPADVLVNEGDIYSAAGFDLEVHETPGHSIGHVIFVWKASQPIVVFGGDVLFAGSVGRTDFPDGDFEQLLDSIDRHFFTLPGDTVILPGHGGGTTVDNEQRTNPVVGKIARARRA